jgi:hypothetical protein
VFNSGSLIECVPVVPVARRQEDGLSSVYVFPPFPFPLSPPFPPPPRLLYPEVACPEVDCPGGINAIAGFRGCIGACTNDFSTAIAAGDTVIGSGEPPPEDTAFCPCCSPPPGTVTVNSTHRVLPSLVPPCFRSKYSLDCIDSCPPCPPAAAAALAAALPPLGDADTNDAMRLTPTVATGVVAGVAGMAVTVTTAMC